MTFSKFTTNVDDLPELLQIRKTSESTLSSFSSDGADLISFGTGATHLSSTRPPSSTSFLEDGIELTESEYKSATKARSSVYVSVSGTPFSVPEDAFAKLEKLKWTKGREGKWQLKTSTAIFEILLSYILFETLPAIDTLSQKEYDEFEPMALSLGLYELVEHFDRSSDKRLKNKGRRRSLTLKLKHNKATSIVLNSENLNATSVKLMAANNKCARFVASLTGSMRARRSVKKTHDQCCAASDHLN